MIKDSKIIGTKIAAPFGWKKFKVGELFDVKLSQSDNKINELPVGNIPLVSSGIKNSGVVGYVSSDLLGLSPFKDSIVADMFGNWTVHEGDFYAVSHGRVNILKPNFVFSSFSCLFICSVGMKHTLGLYGFDNMLSSEKIKNIELDLPVTPNNQPDFEWMSAYMKVVTQDYLEQKELSNQREIKDYLTAGKVDSTDVTDDDRQFLRNFEKLPRRKFKVRELFNEINRGNIFNRSDLVFVASKNNDAIRFVAQSDSNNGDFGFVKNLDDLKHFCDSIVIGRQTGCVYYEHGEFVTTDGLLVLSFNRHVSEQCYLYLVSIFRRLLSNFGYTNTVSAAKLAALDLELPVIIDSSQVDVQSIEKYMRIQSKPLINKVADTLAPVEGKL